MGERTYFSIGDVLTVLKEEFPDVTISKIRFLESQGLIDPERTPSGYRKFYAGDVERLRWILRQQREHFLPLKVIKDRLNGGEPEVDAASTDAVEPGQQAQLALSEGDPPPLFESNGHSAAIAHDVEHEVVAVGASSVAVLSSGVTGGSSEPPKRPKGKVKADVPSGTGPSSSPSASAAAPSPKAPTKGAIRRSEGRASARPMPAIFRADAPPNTLTRDELLDECGLGDEAFDELVSFGLVSGVVVGGSTYYDPDEVEVAKLAARFAASGFGARHLRASKVAAEREAGMLEQAILPMVRQRNPEARRRAQATLDELRSLSADLHAVLLRKALTRSLGES
jgi:DNA-binding transcriptional MerR regulator